MAIPMSDVAQAAHGNKTMINDSIEFTIHEDGHSFTRKLHVDGLVIAGWTGRDPIARDKHIAELVELGVSRP